MKRQTLLSKLGGNQFASLPALKCLRLVFNDFATLKNVCVVFQICLLLASSRREFIVLLQLL